MHWYEPRAKKKIQSLSLRKIFLSLSLMHKKTMENVRKYRDIKTATAEARKNYLFSEPNCHEIIFLSDDSLTIEMRKTWLLINNIV